VFVIPTLVITQKPTTAIAFGLVAAIAVNGKKDKRVLVQK